MAALPKINRRMFQDARIWLEIITLPSEQQKKIKELAAPDADRLKLLKGGCCNMDSDWIREDYYEEIK